jgi:hypothetical protein
MKMTYWTDNDGVAWAQKVHWALSEYGNLVYAFSSSGVYCPNEGAVSYFNKQYPRTSYSSIDEVFYRYVGNFATLVCKNSHFSVVTNNPKCKYCAESLIPIQILGAERGLLFDIDGYLAANGHACLQSIELDGRYEHYVSEDDFLLHYRIAGVKDQKLAVRRLFDRGVIVKCKKP